jgi:hypothetical protein
MRRREREQEYLQQMNDGHHQMDMEGEGGEVEDNEYQHDDGRQQENYPLRYKQHQMQ